MNLLHLVDYISFITAIYMQEHDKQYGSGLFMRECADRFAISWTFDRYNTTKPT